MYLKKMFGKKLKAIREAKGLTQQELADLINLQPNTIGQIEIGYRAVSFNTLEAIAEKLNVSFYELFDFEEIKTTNSLMTSLMREIANLDDKTLKFLLESVKRFTKLLKDQ
jgi:transcriptional regulator with XRE-family HTH domain